jgi:hypothetical protein
MFFNPVDFKRQKVGVNIFKDDIAQSPKVDVITEPVITEPIIEPIITEPLVVQVTEAIVELSIVDEPKTISIMDIDVKEENL